MECLFSEKKESRLDDLGGPYDDPRFERVREVERVRELRRSLPLRKPLDKLGCP